MDLWVSLLAVAFAAKAITFPNWLMTHHMRCFLFFLQVSLQGGGAREEDKFSNLRGGGADRVGKGGRGYMHEMGFM